VLQLAAALFLEYVCEVFEFIGPSPYKLIDVDELWDICCERRFYLVYVLPVLL
jgi:hypothetical protein